jgi:hypothetical protein
MKEIKAKEGYYLSDKNKTAFFKSVKGANVNADDYIEITEEEVNGIVKHNEAIQDIDSLEKIDDYAYKMSVIPECINTTPMANNEAIERKSLFPMWSSDGISVKQGEKYQCDDLLWECVKDHTTQANWKPSLETASLWKVVNEEHEGTEAEPIPYTPPMEIFANKYYTQNGVLYRCTRDSGIPLSHDLSALVGLYVELV